MSSDGVYYRESAGTEAEFFKGALLMEVTHLGDPIGNKCGLLVPQLHYWYRGRKRIGEGGCI